MSDNSEKSRKYLEILDKLLLEKTTYVLTSLSSITKALDCLEKEGMLSPEIIEQQRKIVSEEKRNLIKIMTEGESKDLFQIKYK